MEFTYYIIHCILSCLVPSIRHYLLSHKSTEPNRIIGARTGKANRVDLRALPGLGWF